MTFQVWKQTSNEKGKETVVHEDKVGDRQIQEEAGIKNAAEHQRGM